MVAITEPSLIRRIKDYLGLRSQVINISKNSVLPVIICNPDSRPVPVRFPTGVMKITDQAKTANNSNRVVLRTVPNNKRWFVFGVYLERKTGSTSTVSQVEVQSMDTKNSTDGFGYGFPLKIQAGASSLDTGILNQPIVMEQGWTLEFIATASDDFYTRVIYAEDEVFQ